MRELFLNSKVRLILALGIIVIIVASLGGVYYMGQVNKSKALKGTKSKASTNTLESTISSTCFLDFTIPTPTPTATPIPTSTPVPTLPPVPVCLNNADIALVIDRSSTMTSKEGDKLKMEWAKDAAKTFVTAIQKSGKTNIRVSVTSFGVQGNDGTGKVTPVAENNSTLHTELTTDYTTVLKKIDEIKYIKSGTCIECGIRIGNQTLANSPNAKYLILLSDGMANHTWNGGTSDAKNAAIKQANATGVTYSAMGYGDKTKSGQIDEVTLKAIVGPTGTYVYKPTADQWAQGFLEILTKMCTEPPTTVTSTPIPTATPTPKSTTCVVPPPKDPPNVACAPEGGTGSITWAWKPVETATQYEVDITDSTGKKIIDNGWLAVSTFNCATGTCSYTTPNLALGVYQSNIRAGTTDGCTPSTISISKKIEVKACPVVVTGPQCSSNPVDIVLALDRSGSMTSSKVNGKTKLQWEKDAAKAFVETIKGQKNVRIGVTSWAGNNYELDNDKNKLELQTDLSKVTKFIDAIGTNKKNGVDSDIYTCIECAINKGATLLMNSKNRKVIVMMSDGIGNRVISSCDKNGTCKNAEPCDSREMIKYTGTHCSPADAAAITLAKNTRAEDITIHVVGYGTVEPKRIMVDNLKAIAGSKTSTNSTEFYHYGGDETTWDAVFANVVPQICSETKEKAKEQTKRSTDRNRREGSRHDKDQGDD